MNSVADLAVSGTKNSRVVYSQNFDTSIATTADLYGHGTHVAGIIAGNGTSSTCGNCDVTFRGIAPNASIINLRVLDQNGSATDSTVIAAIQQAIALKSPGSFMPGRGTGMERGHRGSGSCGQLRAR